MLENHMNSCFDRERERATHRFASFDTLQSRDQKEAFVSDSEFIHRSLYIKSSFKWHCWLGAMKSAHCSGFHSDWPSVPGVAWLDFDWSRMRFPVAGWQEPLSFHRSSPSSPFCLRLEHQRDGGDSLARDCTNHLTITSRSHLITCQLCRHFGAVVQHQIVYAFDGDVGDRGHLQ